MGATTFSLFFALCLVCSGAARAETLSAAGALPRVIETFEVGDNVYARAVTVEPKKNALWVGTSAGVHEIDLATQGGSVDRHLGRSQPGRSAHHEVHHLCEGADQRMSLRHRGGQA